MPEDKSIDCRVISPGVDGRLAHVFGDYYSMGYAYGSLLKDEMKEFFPKVWKHFEEQITSVIPSWIPSWLAEIIANEGLDVGLDAVCKCPSLLCWRSRKRERERDCVCAWVFPSRQGLVPLPLPNDLCDCL